MVGGPALDCRYVTLSSAGDRLLGTPPQRAQQQADMSWMVADAELFSIDHRDALGGPDLTDEGKRFGILGEQTGKQCELLGD